jgi:hypothetical protein
MTVRVKAEAILLLAKAKDPAPREKAAAIPMMLMEKAVKDTMNILPRVPKDLRTLEKAAAILMMMMEKAVKDTMNILPRVPKDLRTLEKAAAIPTALKVKDTLERVKATSQPKSL